MLQNYPQGKENTYPAKGGKPENRKSHRLWHRNGIMKPKNTKRSSMRSGSFLAGQNSPNPISVLVDPPGLGIGRVGGSFFGIRFPGIFWKMNKKKTSINYIICSFWERENSWIELFGHCLFLTCAPRKKSWRKRVHFDY